MNEFMRYFNLGVIVFSSAVVGLFIGTLLDGALKVYPLFTVIMLFLGIIAGLWGMYKSIKDLV